MRELSQKSIFLFGQPSFKGIRDFETRIRGYDLQASQEGFACIYLVRNFSVVKEITTEPQVSQKVTRSDCPMISAPTCRWDEGSESMAQCQRPDRCAVLRCGVRYWPFPIASAIHQPR